MQHEARQSILPNGLVIEHELGMSAHGANRILSLKVPAAIAQAFPLHNETVATSGWEHVGVPVGTAFAVGLVWLVCGIFVRRTAKPRWGSELDEFGMPIWRCVTGLWSQCFVFPALFLCSLAQWGFSMQAWQQASGEHLFTPDGQRYYDWAFVYIFAGYMVEDFVLHRCSALMVAHHAGCLLGLAFAFIGVPAGFPWFFAGVVSLELGSAVLNLHCLWPKDRRALYAFMVGMTISNVAAVYFALRWTAHAAYWSSIGLDLVLTATFVYFRQEPVIDEALKLLRASRGKDHAE